MPSDYSGNEEGGVQNLPVDTDNLNKPAVDTSPIVALPVDGDSANAGSLYQPLKTAFDWLAYVMKNAAFAPVARLYTVAQKLGAGGWLSKLLVSETDTFNDEAWTDGYIAKIIGGLYAQAVGYDGAAIKAAGFDSGDDGDGGLGLQVKGGDGSSGGVGISATGGTGSLGGFGIAATGGDGSTVAGAGMMAVGGTGGVGKDGGPGIEAYGGSGTGANRGPAVLAHDNIIATDSFHTVMLTPEGDVTASGNVTADGTVQGATVHSTGDVTADGNVTAASGTVQGANILATDYIRGLYLRGVDVDSATLTDIINVSSAAIGDHSGYVSGEVSVPAVSAGSEIVRFKCEVGGPFNGKARLFLSGVASGAGAGPGDARPFYAKWDAVNSRYSVYSTVDTVAGDILYYFIVKR